MLKEQALALVQCLAGVAHQLMGHLCGNPVHINYLYRTGRTDAGVKQWPLRENLQSFQFPFLQRAQMQVWTSGNCDRTILFTVSIFAKVRSMKSVFSAMLRSEKAGVFQTPQTLCEEDSLVADAAVLRLPEILSLLGITLPVPVPSRMSRASINFCHAERTSTCLSSMPVLPINWWDIRAAIQFTLNHHYRTESTDAGVSKWPLWENHSLHSFQIRKGSGQ